MSDQVGNDKAFRQGTTDFLSYNLRFVHIGLLNKRLVPHPPEISLKQLTTIMSAGYVSVTEFPEIVNNATDEGS